MHVCILDFSRIAGNQKHNTWCISCVVLQVVSMHAHRNTHIRACTTHKQRGGRQKQSLLHVTALVRTTVTTHQYNYTHILFIRSPLLDLTCALAVYVIISNSNQPRPCDTVISMTLYSLSQKAHKPTVCDTSVKLTNYRLTWKTTDLKQTRHCTSF